MEPQKHEFIQGKIHFHFFRQPSQMFGSGVLQRAVLEVLDRDCFFVGDIVFLFDGGEVHYAIVFLVF